MDFEIIKEDEMIDDSLSKHVLILAPICADNDELKEKEGEDILYSDESYNAFK